MVPWIMYGMIYLGSALMVFNIIGFIRFAYYVRSNQAIETATGILYVPVILLVFFFLGYLGIGLFGKPDLLVAGILFGGSVFVFIMYLLLNSITRRIIENEQLKTELRAAEESNRTKSAFLASMSHEMRTPMNVILGLSTVAQKNPETPEEVRAQLQKISRSGNHLLQMINNILDLNNMESGEVHLVNENFCMEKLLTQVNEVGTLFCSEKGLNFEVRIQEGVKGCYCGDSGQIEQILLAILNNAAKYTDAPGTVTFSAEQTEYKDCPNAVKFEIRDTGIGIDEAFLPQIYELFSQEDSSSTNRFGGSGIGLAVTKSKVDLFGGSITVESRKHEGACFTVILPLKKLDLPAGTKDCMEQKAEPVDEGTLEEKRILIVEDMEENAEIVADLLELEGAESERAENGQVALDLFLASEPGYYDAILMDLRMPVLDGLEAAKRIRASSHPDAKTVPILALTANAFESDVEKSMEAGMNEHLVKPVDADKLYEALRHYIRTAL